MARRIRGRRVRGVTAPKALERAYNKALRRQLLEPMIAPFMEAVRFAGNRYDEIRSRLEAVNPPAVPRSGHYPDGARTGRGNRGVPETGLCPRDGAGPGD